MDDTMMPLLLPRSFHFISQFSTLNQQTMPISLISHSIVPTPTPSICNRRIHNLLLPTFTHSSLTTNFPQRPIPPLKPQSFNLSSLLSFQPLHPPPFAAIDDFQPSQQDNPESESETFDKPEQEEQGNVSSNSNDSGRIFVGNLPYSMTSSQLADIFREAGTVVSVEVVYDLVTDRSRGFAFVTMGSVEDAKEAIRMFDGSQFGGRAAKVNFPEVPRGGERLVMGSKIRNNYKGFVDSPHKIYAGNLDWGLTSQELRDAFAEQPGLLAAKVIYERDRARSRGFGFVTFETAEHLEAALKVMNGVEVQGRPLRLNSAADRAPSSAPVIEKNARSNVDSSENLSSVTT